MSAAQETVQELKCELLGHLSYFVGLCNPLEEHLDGKYFSGDAEVEYEMHFLWLFSRS
jgi:hypothetical protein